MPRPLPSLKISLLLMALASASTPTRATERVASEDLVDYVARRLPALPDSGSSADGGLRFQVEINRAPAQVRIQQRSNISVAGANSAHYQGWLGDAPAFFIHNDHQFYMLLPQGERLKRYRFTRHQPGYRYRASARRPGKALASERITGSKPRRSLSAMDAASGAQRLRVYVFLHDDLGVRGYGDVHADYFSWWSADLLQRLPDKISHIEMNYIRKQPGSTDFPYREPGVAGLDEWGGRAWRFAAQQGGFSFDDDAEKRTKFLLLTASGPDHGRTAIAVNGGTVAIASWRDVQTPAHVLGHTLGATHAEAEIRYRNGWWCETNMVNPSLDLRQRCRTYSDANIENIRNYFGQ